MPNFLVPKQFNRLFKPVDNFSGSPKQIPSGDHFPEGFLLPVNPANSRRFNASLRKVHRSAGWYGTNPVFRGNVPP